jgi:hypothetical protein
MAYMSQEKKKKIAEELKKVLKGTGIKYTLGVHNHSTIVMKIKAGPVDFIGNYIETLSQKPQYQRTMDTKMTYMQVNDFHYKDQFTGKALEILEKIIPTMNVGNHNRSDILTDYFDVGWYLSVNIGTWDAPYQVVN